MSLVKHSTNKNSDTWKDITVTTSLIMTFYNKYMNPQKLLWNRFD